MIVCASPSYLRANGQPLTIEEIAGHHAVVYRRSGPVPPWLFPRADQPPAGVAPRSRPRLDDLEAIAKAATCGAGLAWLPASLIRDRLETGALVHVLPAETGFLYEAHALWLRTPHLPMKVRLAVDALAAALPGMM